VIGVVVWGRIDDGKILTLRNEDTFNVRTLKIDILFGLLHALFTSEMQRKDGLLNHLTVLVSICMGDRHTGPAWQPRQLTQQNAYAKWIYTYSSKLPQSELAFSLNSFIIICENMPLYEVEYSIPLTETHKNDLAKAITKIHHLAYGIPSFFISIKFTDGSKNENYSGGKIVSCAFIQHPRTD